ncbi:MAG: methyltransferase domain-containing protein [Chloroflexota bacterium]|nr:methyltransferase domain-containing protein [Chloroflexota bacterium]
MLSHLADPMGLLTRIYEASLPLERDAIQLALELAHPRPEERLLDVATGTGAMLRELARRDLHPACMIGIDRSMRMLSGVVRLPQPYRVAVGDGRALPLPDDSFDVVSACYVLHLLAVQDRRRVLAEIRRVVRPGGRVVIVTVDAARRDVRRVLSALPSWTTLHRVDAAGELSAAGLHVVEGRYARSGWPSVCLLALREL